MIPVMSFRQLVKMCGTYKDKKSFYMHYTLLINLQLYNIIWYWAQQKLGQYNISQTSNMWGVFHELFISLRVSDAYIGSDNGLSPGQRQVIIWINTVILLIEPLGTNISEIFIAIHKFSFKKMHLKTLSAKWQPFCLGLNVLKKSDKEKRSERYQEGTCISIPIVRIRKCETFLFSLEFIHW